MPHYEKPVHARVVVNRVDYLKGHTFQVPGSRFQVRWLLRRIIRAMATQLGSKLKSARERLGLSRSVVARQSEIDAAVLFRIENADNAAPTFAVVGRITRVLGVSLEWLAINNETQRGQMLGEAVLLTSEARSALVSTAQHLEIAISGLSQPGRGAARDGDNLSSTVHKRRVVKKNRSKRKVNRS